MTFFNNYQNQYHMINTLSIDTMIQIIDLGSTFWSDVPAYLYNPHNQLDAPLWLVFYLCFEEGLSDHI